LTVATTGEGVDDVVAAIDAHREHAQSSGAWQKRRLARLRREVEAIALAKIQQRFAHLSSDIRLDTLAQQILDGTGDPFTAADALIDQL
jgi:LAO/AO transport system kinase